MEVDTRLFLDAFTDLDVNLSVAERAVAIRRARRIKLPEALIRATAATRGHFGSPARPRIFRRTRSASVCPAPADRIRREPTVVALETGAGVVGTTARRYTTWV